MRFLRTATLRFRVLTLCILGLAVSCIDAVGEQGADGVDASVAPGRGGSGTTSGAGGAGSSSTSGEPGGSSSSGGVSSSGASGGSLNSSGSIPCGWSEICGTCGRHCTGGQDCSQGLCCPRGWIACPIPDGVGCTYTRIDSSNCGACSRRCAAGQQCSAAHCIATCGSEYGDSLFTCPLPDGGISCTDLLWDFSNCGYCGNTCAPGQECGGGSCGPSG